MALLGMGVISGEDGLFKENGYSDYQDYIKNYRDKGKWLMVFAGLKGSLIGYKIVIGASKTISGIKAVNQKVDDLREEIADALSHVAMALSNIYENSEVSLDYKAKQALLNLNSRIAKMKNTDELD